MLTGIITQDNTVILSDDGYPIIESEKPSVPEYCKAVSRYTETDGKIIQSWEVTPQLSKEEAIDKFIASQVSTTPTTWATKSPTMANTTRASTTAACGPRTPIRRGGRSRSCLVIFRIHICRSTEDSNTETIRCSQMRRIRLRPRIRHSRLQIRLLPCTPVAATITSLSDRTSGGIL